MNTPIVSIVGKSNSGKTTLIEKLLHLFCSRGLKVATIKHDAHQCDIDHPGKDTWRHREAGADAVVIASTGRLFLTQNLAAPISLDDIRQTYLHNHYDLILTEGFKKSSTPKIEVHRLARSSQLLYTPEDQTFIAVATDRQGLNLPIPILDLNDAVAIANFITKRFVKP